MLLLLPVGCFEVTHAWSSVGRQDGRTLSGSSMKKTEETSGTALLRRTCSPGRIVAAVVCTALQYSSLILGLVMLNMKATGGWRSTQRHRLPARTATVIESAPADHAVCITSRHRHRAPVVHILQRGRAEPGHYQ